MAAVERPLVRVISSCLPGVDKIALVIAKECGLETGGCAMPGFGTRRKDLYDKYDLCELDTGTYGMTEEEAFTEQLRTNVCSGHATLVFRVHASQNTDRVIGYCMTGLNKDNWDVPAYLGGMHKCRPVKIVSLHDCPKEMLYLEAKGIGDFIIRHKVQQLHVTGHHADEIVPEDWHERVKTVLRMVFTNYQ